MQLLYKYPEGEGSIVKIDEGFYYFGEGSWGVFAWTPEVFLRFEPYIEAAKEGDRIPDQVLDFISSHAEQAADAMAQRAKEKRTDKVQVTIDPEGNIH